MRFNGAVGTGVLSLACVFSVHSGALAAPGKPFTKASDCVVGQRVIDRDNQASVVVEARGTTCVVQLDSTGKKDYNLFWMLRPAAPGGTEKPTSNARIATGLYPCYSLAGTQLNYAFIDIRIDGPDRYRDKSGKAGRYEVKDNDQIVFTGPLAAAHAKLLSGGRIGLNMSGGNFFNTTCSKSK